MIKSILLGEWVIGILLVAFIVTQLLIPAFRKTAIFPILRTKRQEAHEKVIAAHEERDIRNMQDEARTFGVSPPPARPERGTPNTSKPKPRRS